MLFRDFGGTGHGGGYYSILVSLVKFEALVASFKILSCTGPQKVYEKY